MKYKVTGVAKYEYEVEAEDEDTALDLAMERFDNETFQTWEAVLDWQAEQVV